MTVSSSSPSSEAPVAAPGNPPGTLADAAGRADGSGMNDEGVSSEPSVCAVSPGQSAGLRAWVGGETYHHRRRRSGAGRRLRQQHRRASFLLCGSSGQVQHWAFDRCSRVANALLRLGQDALDHVPRSPALLRIRVLDRQRAVPTPKHSQRPQPHTRVHANAPLLAASEELGLVLLIIIVIVVAVRDPADPRSTSTARRSGSGRGVEVAQGGDARACIRAERVRRGRTSRRRPALAITVLLQGAEGMDVRARGSTHARGRARSTQRAARAPRAGSGGRSGSLQGRLGSSSRGRLVVVVFVVLHELVVLGRCWSTSSGRSTARLEEGLDRSLHAARSALGGKRSAGTHLEVPAARLEEEGRLLD